MNRREYSESLLAIYVIAAAVRRLGLPTMLAAIEQAEAFGPVIDPTAFIEKGEAMRQDRRVVAILAAAQAKLDALPWPAAQHTQSDVPFSVFMADMLGRMDRAIAAIDGPTNDEPDCAGGGAFDGDPSRVVVGQVLV
jgi:hypothetical protein